MRRAVGVAVVLLALYAAGVWLLGLRRSLQVTRERLYRIQAVSIGMSRSAVVARLGPPIHAEKDSEVIAGAGEVLMYPSTGRVPDDMWVVLDHTGRVASVVYPDIGELTKGELSIRTGAPSSHQ